MSLENIPNEKNIEDNFKVNDSVWWYYCGDCNLREEGIIRKIDDDNINIKLPYHGKCDVSINAKKVDGQWLVHRSYVGYKEPLHKV